MSQAFVYLEEYIEYISGMRTGTAGKVAWYVPVKLNVRAANYDVGFLNSLRSQFHNGIGLTDRQAELCQKLVQKYSRQLKAQGIDVPAGPLPLRGQLREVNRDSRVTLDGARIAITFPYNGVQVDALREIARHAAGEMRWVPCREDALGHWTVAPTAPNIRAVVGFAQQHGFDIDPAVLVLWDQIRNHRRDGLLELAPNGSGWAVGGAPPALVDWVETRGGGWGEDNFLKLVNLAPLLGFQLGETAYNLMRDRYGPAVAQILDHHVTTINPQMFETRVLDGLLSFHSDAGISPVYIYDPNKMLSNDISFKPPQVIRVNKCEMPAATIVVCVNSLYTPQVVEVMNNCNRVVQVSYLNTNDLTKKAKRVTV